MSTFADDLSEVALEPGRGGIFEIICDDERIWDRKADNGFPSVRDLKQRVRDRVDKDRDLGHVDRRGPVVSDET